MRTYQVRGASFESTPPLVTEQGLKTFVHFMVALLLGLAIWAARAFLGLKLPFIDY